MSTRQVSIDPHHPNCRYDTDEQTSTWGGWDPERCCYCAALIRQQLPSSRHEDPLDYRYGGPGCGCSPDPREREF